MRVSNRGPSERGCTDGGCGQVRRHPATVHAGQGRGYRRKPEGTTGKSNGNGGGGGGGMSVQVIHLKST